MLGFNKKRKSSIGGDFDGDGVKNRKDCEPLNWKKQGPEHEGKTAKTCSECGKTAKTKYGHELKWATYDYDIWAICECGNKWLLSRDY